MSDEPQAAVEENAPEQLEEVTYEVLRRRLLKHGEELQGCLSQLNTDRRGPAVPE